MTDETNGGEFRGGVKVRLQHLEADIKEIKSDVRILKERQDKFLGVIAVGSFVVPLILKALWP